MHKTLYKWIAAAAVICCLLSGCGGNSTETGGPDTSPDVSGAGDDLAGLFDDNSPTIEIGGFSYGWPDERDVFTYSGEPLEIPFYLTGAMDFSQEIGLLIFVDGIAQPYSAVFPDGTKKAEAYMQVFELEKAAENRFNVVFQHVTGKTGDSLSIQAVTILSPSYMPAGTENPSYGIYHSENLTLPLQIAYEADAPAENKRTATDKYDITDIPKSVTDTNAYFDMDTLDTVNYLSIVPADGEDNSILYSQDGFATFKIMLYGGPEADNNITVFVNHQPVQLGGADYLAVRTVKGKMVEATITLDVSSFGKLNTLYAIASSTGRDSDLTETLHFSLYAHDWSGVWSCRALPGGWRGLVRRGDRAHFCLMQKNRVDHICRNQRVALAPLIRRRFLKYVLPLPAGLLAGTGYLWGTLTEPRFNADFSEIKDVVVFRGVSPKEFLVLLVMFSIVLLLLLAFTVRRYVGRKLSVTIRLSRRAVLMSILSLLFLTGCSGRVSTATACDFRLTGQGLYFINRMDSDCVYLCGRDGVASLKISNKPALSVDYDGEKVTMILKSDWKEVIFEP